MWLVLQQDRGRAFLAFCLCGFIIGCIYDAFRIVRTVYSGGRIKLFFEDVLFCIMAALVFVVFAFNVSLGVVRMFAAIGALLGFFVYRFTLGVFTVRVARYVKALLTPPLRRLVVLINLALDKTKQRVYTYRRARRDSRLAAKGF